MKRNWVLWLVVFALLIGGTWLGLRWLDAAVPADGQDRVKVRLQIEDQRTQAELLRNDDGSYSYLLWRFDGSVERLSPEAFAAAIYEQEITGNFVAKLFNISSAAGIVWVSLGLLGQLMFTGRMLVQWIASERNKRSVVPPMFWWMSVLGALMLLAYFLWRRDVVGVLGQSCGLAIYLRNIHLIVRSRFAPAATRDDVDE